MATKTAWQNIRIEPAQKARLHKAKKLTKLPVAKIIDEAIDEKLDRLARKHPQLKAA